MLLKRFFLTPSLKNLIKHLKKQLKGKTFPLDNFMEKQGLATLVMDPNNPNDKGLTLMVNSGKFIPGTTDAAGNRVSDSVILNIGDGRFVNFDLRVFKDSARLEKLYKTFSRFSLGVLSLVSTYAFIVEKKLKYFFIDVTFFKLVTLTTKTRMDFSKKERFMQAYAPVHGRFERYCKTRSYKELPFEDLMQDTLLIAFEKFDNLKSKDAFLHFLFGTAAKVLSNYRKKKKLEYVENFSTQYEHINTSSIEIEKQLEINCLYEQIENLDSITRECIILFEISGFSIKEIMVILNLGESAIKQRLSRGRKQLIVQMNLLEK